jgi:hypothetical protein
MFVISQLTYKISLGILTGQIILCLSSELFLLELSYCHLFFFFLKDMRAMFECKHGSDFFKREEDFIVTAVCKLTIV